MYVDTPPSRRWSVTSTSGLLEGGLRPGAPALESGVERGQSERAGSAADTASPSDRAHAHRDNTHTVCTPDTMTMARSSPQEPQTRSNHEKMSNSSREAPYKALQAVQVIKNEWGPRKPSQPRGASGDTTNL